jgi:SAM-dependent methyltransferase
MTDATMQPKRTAGRTLRRIAHPLSFPAIAHFAALLLLAAALWANTAFAQIKPGLDVPYVPTPQNVVERMLQMADVKAGDFVIDLGCGDGRMVVTAASQFGARALGVDIDPVRIREANGNAARAGVTDKVEFRIGDLFDVDISGADVLAIYLLNEINLRLRPKILETMRPGARVVSHAFDMGEWQPDERETIGGRKLYLWIVPARVAGRWHIEQGERRMEVTFRQHFQALSGTATIDGEAVPLYDGRVRGNEIHFVIGTPPGAAQSFRGRIDGDRIEALGSDASPWQATRAAP